MAMIGALDFHYRGRARPSRFVAKIARTLRLADGFRWCDMGKAGADVEPEFRGDGTPPHGRGERSGQGRVHRWLAPPVQVQICRRVPSAELTPVASRHLPEPTLISWVPLTVHACALVPLQS